MSFTFSKPRDFNIGSVCALYLLRVIILTALFCSLGNLPEWSPQDRMLKFRCGKIIELYIVLSVYVGRKCWSLFMTPSVRDILLAILSVCGAQFNVSCIVVPRKLNSHMYLFTFLNSNLFSAVRHRVVKSDKSCIWFCLY